MLKRDIFLLLFWLKYFCIQFVYFFVTFFFLMSKRINIHVNLLSNLVLKWILFLNSVLIIKERKKNKWKKENDYSYTYMLFLVMQLWWIWMNINAECIVDKLFLYSTQLDIDQALQVMKYEDIAWSIYRFRYINFSVHLLPINPFYNKQSLVSNA